MRPDLLHRIDRRLAQVQISAKAACRIAGHADLVQNLRRATRAGRPYAPSPSAIAALAPVLFTTPQWLLYEAGPEVKIPDTETQAKVAAARERGRKPKSASGDVIIADNEAPVVVVHQQAEGDATSGNVAGHTLGTAPSPHAAELFGLLLEAVAAVYRQAGEEPPLAELGRLTYEQHGQLAGVAASPDEFPALIEIATLRTRKKLAGS